jgi:TonB family protein
MTQIKDTGRQSDLLLYVAGGVVAAVGVTWLVILKPWGSSAPAPAEQPAAAQVVAMADTPPPPSGDDAPSTPAAALDNPLRMADLAFQAGMLVEPEEYSAWTLYRGVVKAEPNNQAAVQGLNKVADELVRRGETALEQGRFDDARAIVERIRAALPAHAGAKALAEKIWPAGAGRAAVAESSFKPELPVQAPPPKVAPVQVKEEPAKPVVDPVVEMNQKFEDAMTAGRLLTPSDQSAKHYVELMVAKHANDERTRAARDRLSREFLARSSQSLEAHDTDAAGVWIDEAEHLGADPNAVHTARTQLVDLQVALESAKPIPASAMKVKSYAKPVYPARALDRGIEGWVDVEFTVEPDGSTSHVTVAAASNDTFFRKEAVAAVEQWKFEPRVFMNRPIAQRSYTRIRFASQ